MIKLGVDARMTNWSGIGTYSTRVISSLAEISGIELVLFTNPSDNAYEGPRHGRFRIVPVDVPVFSIRSRRWSKAIATADIDVFFNPYILIPYRIPCRAVGTIHDMIPWRIPNVQKRLAGRLFYRPLISAAVKNYQRILVDSEFTGNDVRNILKVPAKTVKVVPAAASEDFVKLTDTDMLERVRTKFELAEPIILNIGTARLHKNLDFLIRAFKRCRETYVSDLRLVFAGPEGFLRPAHRALVKEHGLQKHVAFIGEVTQEDLPAIYNLARLCAYPSLMEGFGLPALESMACGTPVVCTNGSSLAEVVNGAGILLDPGDEEKWAEAFYRIETDNELHMKLSVAGLDRARQFSWSKTAESIYDAVREVAGR